MAKPALEDLEEAQSRWRWTVGRNKALAEPIPAFPIAPTLPPVQSSQRVSHDMEMIERVMLNQPGLTREQAQQQLGEAGY